MKKNYIITSIALFLVFLSFANCDMFKNKMVIKDGSKVSINYVLKVDGNIVDSSEGKGPLAYTQGSGQIIPGLEKQLVGLKAGDKKIVAVAPAEGYGEKNPDGIRKVARKDFKDPGALKVGAAVNGSVEGEQFRAMVVAMDDKEVTLDFNHPLAGKTLNFEIEVVKVE